ncbi:hypothetical protein AS4_17780 [Acinetobacter guillouiae]|nr:hypothetical protein AS4_17780 [Acinetobacter guillouiae]
MNPWVYIYQLQYKHYAQSEDTPKLKYDIGNSCRIMIKTLFYLKF